jgi:hypothetical protein
MMTVKNHSMALKDGTTIEIDTLNSTSSASGWVCRLTLSQKGDQPLAAYLTNEEAVKLGVTLFRVVAH